MFMNKVWRVVDAITTTCPLCAFVRGSVAGATLGALVAMWLM